MMQQTAGEDDAVAVSGQFEPRESSFHQTDPLLKSAALQIPPRLVEHCRGAVHGIDVPAP